MVWPSGTQLHLAENARRCGRGPRQPSLFGRHGGYPLGIQVEDEQPNGEQELRGAWKMPPKRDAPFASVKGLGYATDIWVFYAP